MCGLQDKNPRDLLMHLHQWHKMAIKWHQDNMSGKKKSFLPEGFNWKMTPELNFELWKEYQDIDLEKAKTLAKKSHKKLMKIIQAHSDKELFTKKYYDWTGSSSLGSYLISATASHYDWASKRLKSFD